jgi:hypothetical protein
MRALAAQLRAMSDPGYAVAEQAAKVARKRPSGSGGLLLRPDQSASRRPLVQIETRQRIAN